MKFQVCKLHKYATLPARQSAGAAGYDLYLADDFVLDSNQRKLAPTGIAVAIPSNCYGRIALRSSLAVQGIDIGAGVIDSDYRGEVNVLLINTGERRKFKKGERIAQLILQKIILPETEEVEALPFTDRGTGGFGSTGI